jgi:hypothetical protein
LEWRVERPLVGGSEACSWRWRPTREWGAAEVMAKGGEEDGEREKR